MKHNCKCNDDYNYNCKCDCSIPYDECGNYTEISNEKCKQAACINEEAEEIAKCAANLEEEAEELVNEANALICQAQKCWEKYNYLISQSTFLIEDAQEALHNAIECQRKHCKKPVNQGNCMSCNETYPPPCKGPCTTPRKKNCC